MSIPHPKGGSIVWTCVKDHIIDEKEQNKAIGLCGFDYKLFEEDEGGRVREVLEGYPYLKNIIELRPGYLVKQMAKINKMVGMNNRILMSGGKKWLRLVCNFTRQEFWKCIVCILLVVKYG